MSEQQLAIPSAKALNQIGRLRRKLAQRDQRIAGLMRRVEMLESALSTKDMEMKRLPNDVTRAVQRALCNVRLIPMIGIGGNGKILDVRYADPEKEQS